MSNPDFPELKARLENHIRLLIDQPIREFQENNGVMIYSIEIRLNKEPTITKSVESVKLYIV
ncbi:MAG: hypothetical protein WC827_03730 [Candidatus Paceibacterota bacterium]|jgi:hypothetical protein